MKASELKPNPKNWRTHPLAQRETLRGLLKEIGYADALLARDLDDGTLELVDGHLRADTTPDSIVPVLILDVDAAEAEKLMLTLDPLAGMAEGDQELLERVETESAAVDALLGELAEEYSLAREETEPAEDPGAEFARADELRNKWQTAPGQAWAIGPHRLLVGDATDQAAVASFFAQRRADIVWTDPPYGVAYQGKTSAQLTIANDALDSDELEAFLSAALGAAAAICRPGAVWYVAAPSGPQFLAFAKVLERLGIWRQTLVWVKDLFVLGRSDYHYQHESVFYGWTENAEHIQPPPRPEDDGLDYLYRQQSILYGWSPGASHTAPLDRRQHTIFEVDRPKRNQEHPTMKPPELVERMLLNSSAKQDLVFDPFLGSGTTMVAAERTGRHCWGLELDPRYAAVILERMCELGLEPALEDGGLS